MKSPTDLAVIIRFLRGLGFRIRLAPIAEPTVLPGIKLENGVMVIDGRALLSPGDVLHEAGHLAVMSPARRQKVSGRFDSSHAEEMMALAWSYAAATELGIEASVVFHAQGYRGGGPSLAESFKKGATLGVPGLCWLGLTREPRTATSAADSVYPRMSSWLNTSERELR